MPDVAELGRKVKAKYPGQYDDLSDDDVGRKVKIKYAGAYDDFADTPAAAPRTLLPTERQEFGRRPATLDESLAQSARINRGRPQRSISTAQGVPVLDAAHQEQYERDAAAHFQRRDQEAFERKPFTERVTERVREAGARGAGQVSRMARQATGAGLGVARGLAAGDFTPVDLPEWRKGEEGRLRTLEKRKLSRPSTFATETAEGIIEALPAASIAALGGIATGGSLPAAMATGGGMAAAGADWRDPKRALTQTTIGAVAPVAGGKLGQVAGGAAARALARPAAQTAARVGGEVVGGAAGNVIGSGAEQLAFEGRLNPRELAKQAVIGGALTVPTGRRRVPAAAPEQVLQPAAQPVTALRQPEAAPVVSPRVQPMRQTAEMPRVATPQSRATAEIPRIPTSPTRQIQYPDAPETQEMPAFRERIAAENAETAELAQPVEKVSPQVLETQAPAPVAIRPPKATDENIASLRARQEELGREAYDRRGDFTGDLRDEYNRLNSIIREYDNARAPRELAPPPARGPERIIPPPEEIAARREALQSRTGPMPETLIEARPVTQEMQIPSALKPTEAFSSREDARQGHFERFDDAELVTEIDRLQDIQNQATRGQSKLSRRELEANRFDLKVAVDMQKERGRQQRAIGIDPANRIAPRTPGRAARKIQHTTLGEVTEAADQKGVPRGKLRVVDETTGKLSVIQNPRTRGNREASFVKGEEAPKVELGGLNDTARERLLNAAREQRDLSEKYYNKKASALPSVNDPIDGEIARLSAEFYGRVAKGENVEAVRDDIAAQAQKAAEDFNARQQQLHGKAMKKDWRSGIAGFMGPDSAASKINRHVYQMAKLIIEKAQPVPPLSAKAAKVGPAAEPVAPMESKGEAAKPSIDERIESTAAAKGYVFIASTAGGYWKHRHRARGRVQFTNKEFAEDAGIPLEDVKQYAERQQATLNKSLGIKTGPAAEPSAPMQSKAKPPDLVQGMKRLARSPSSPVEISQLREQFPGMSKEAFDGEMERLNAEGKIALHRHDHPASLKQAERDKLVKIGNDHFIAATFRERPGEIMGMGLGGLQGMFERGGRAKTPEPGQQPLFESAPKRSLASRAGSNVVSAVTLPRALMSSADLSAPLRQGAILTLPPTQWGRAAKSGIRMLQAISPRQYDRLVGEMNNHPDAKVGKESGLFMATDPKEGSSLRGREEDFISKWAGKIPIVKHSEQAYKTYLDSIRLETFKKYKRVIDGDKKLSLEDREAAYKAAADWINIASGRGSLGKTLDKAMPALSAVFFAPRYTASRIQVLNPLTYAKNSTTPAGRAVLKQQMSDLVQSAGMITATLAIASAAGAEVGLNPEDSDFLKIKIGNTRYDTLAGLQQFMRLYYRVGKDVGLSAQGEKAEGQPATDILGRFARTKLAPIPSFFADMISRKDFTGRKFEMGRGVQERMIPLMWRDFYEAYQREGLGGAAKLSPGFFGVGAQDFEKRPGNLSLGGKLDAELQKHGIDYSRISEIPGDTEQTHRARTTKVEGWINEYGGRLVDHPRYQSLTPDQQKAALENLRRRIGAEANQKRPNMRNFAVIDVIRSVRESERQQPRRDRGKLVVGPEN